MEEWKGQVPEDIIFNLVASWLNLTGAIKGIYMDIESHSSLHVCTIIPSYPLGWDVVWYTLPQVKDKA